MGLCPEMLEQTKPPRLSLPRSRGMVLGALQSPALQLFPICQQFSFGLVKLPGWLELATWALPRLWGLVTRGANPARDSGLACPLNLGVFYIPNSRSRQPLQDFSWQVVLGAPCRSQAGIALKAQENELGAGRHPRGPCPAGKRGRGVGEQESGAGSSRAVFCVIHTWKREKRVSDGFET